MSFRPMTTWWSIAVGSPPMSRRSGAGPRRCFRRRVVPHYEPPVPKWVSDSETQLDAVFARRDLGDEEKLLWGAEGMFAPGAELCRAHERAAEIPLQHRAGPRSGPAAPGRGNRFDCADHALGCDRLLGPAASVAGTVAAA